MTLFRTLPNTTIVFANNSAQYGGAISVMKSNVIFQGITVFVNNSAHCTGGAVSEYWSNVSFIGTNIFTCK